MVFVDTNVLAYMRDPSDPEKQLGAERWMAYLWTSRHGRLSTQVLQEFYVTVTQKLKPPVRRDEARADVRQLFAWRPIPTDGALFDRAWEIQDRFRLSYWDSTIVAAAQIADCRYLLTEDLQAGQDLDGVIVVNPFETDPASLA